MAGRCSKAILPGKGAKDPFGQDPPADTSGS
jgi:hypothetical protein